MSKSKAEKERRYYNRKLIKDGFERELKKPHKIEWKEFFIDSVGIFIGLTLSDIIKLENHINNSFVEFILGVLIIAVSIIVVKLLVYIIIKKKC